MIYRNLINVDILIIAHFITEFVKDGTSRFVYIAEQLSQQHDVEIVTSRFDHIAKKQRTKQHPLHPDRRWGRSDELFHQPDLRGCKKRDQYLCTGKQQAYPRGICRNCQLFP